MVSLSFLGIAAVRPRVSASASMALVDANSLFRPRSGTHSILRRRRNVGVRILLCRRDAVWSYLHRSSNGSEYGSRRLIGLYSSGLGGMILIEPSGFEL